MADASDDLLAQLLTQILARLTAIETAQATLHGEVLARLDRMKSELVQQIRQHGR